MNTYFLLIAYLPLLAGLVFLIVFLRRRHFSACRQVCFPVC